MAFCLLYLQPHSDWCRLIIEIQIGFLNAEVIPELTRYETESWVRYKWDTLQSEYMCCGGYGQHQVLQLSLVTISTAQWSKWEVEMT